MRGTSGKRVRWLVATVAVIFLATGGIVVAIELSSNGKHQGGTEAHAALARLPDMPSDTRQAYEAAPAHSDLFAHLPCYCGCVLLDVPHVSLERCFLLPDGTFEPHAANCRICTDIAVDALAMNAQGLDPPAIRALVDAKYARSGPPTDTPLP